METPSAPQPKLRKEQKVGFVLLLLFGMLAVVLGGLQLRNTIYGPFVVRLEQSEQAEIERLFNNQEARLQQIDTDNDGLNDYEELTFYETSPYLPDSDSDGIDDAQEIEQASDPNCPQGQTCTDVGIIPEEKPDAITSPLLNLQPPDPAQGLGVFNLQDLVSDPAALRQLLRDSGQISEEELAQIDDLALQQLAAELLREQGGATSTEQGQGETTTSTAL